MHVEIDREVEPGRARRRSSSGCARCSATSARPSRTGTGCSSRCATSSTTCERPAAAARRARSSRARRCWSWLADDHFTFLGYREYRLADDGRRRGRCCRARSPAPGSASCAPTRTCPTAFGKLPPLVREKAREKTLLVLAKANSKSTVHRPVYLDYVGRQDLRRRRRGRRGAPLPRAVLLGRLHRVADPHPGACARRPTPCSRPPASTATSHTGKALMDMLETYPRDELFQTPLEELVPIAQAVLHTRERRQLRLFVRHDAYRRYLSCLVYLPRDRYNTAVRERIAAILKRELGGETIEYTARVTRVDARAAALRRAPAARARPWTAEVDVPELEQRLADAARSWPDDFVAAVREEYGEAKGVRLARRYADSFPEAYKEDYPARTGAVDLARLEARGASRARRTGRRGVVAVVLPADGLRSRRGAAQGLPHRPAAVAEPRAADPVDDGRRGRRRAALRARRADRRRRTSTTSGCATRRPMPAARARAVPGRGRGGVGRAQRGRRLQRAGARRRADLAAGDGAARLREVHAPGRHAVRAGLHRGGAAQQRRHHRGLLVELFETRFDPDLYVDDRRAVVRRRSRRPPTRSSRRSTRWPASTTTASCGPT